MMIRLECGAKVPSRRRDGLVAHHRGKRVRVIKLAGIMHSVHCEQKPGNLVKAVERRPPLPPPQSIDRELPTTHRVVIYAMVITCSSVTAAAVAAAANPLRLPWHSSCLSSLSFSRVFYYFPPTSFSTPSSRPASR